jgi:hypothetical protein
MLVSYKRSYVQYQAKKLKNIDRDLKRDIILSKDRKMEAQNIENEFSE